MMQTHRDYFNTLAPEWDERMGDIPGIRQHLDTFGVSRGEYVLDIGAGTGRLAVHLCSLAGCDGLVVAQDLAEEMLRTGKRKTGSAPAWLCDNAACLALRSASFDKVICFSAFPHFSDKEKALAEMARVLKPGGKLLVLHVDSSTRLNEFHAGLPEPVCYDELPPAGDMRELLISSGLEPLTAFEEEGLYWVEGRKPRQVSVPA